MTREIKFRAWHKPTKTMIIGVGVLPLLGVLEHTGEKKVGDVGAYEQQYTYYRPDCVDVMQFTGLLDKNGKEIYEGDIVKYRFEDYDDFTNYVIGWSAGNCQFRGEEIGGERHNLSVYEGMEIIGNIYENPELLKI